MRGLVVAVLCAALGWPAAATAQSPGAGGAEVWDLSEPAAPRHWFTGLRCRERAGDAVFADRVAFIASGADIGCMYEARDLSVTIYATRRPNDEPIESSIALTRQQMGSRYRGATTAFDVQRTLDTPAGPLDVDEFVLAVDGQDLQQNRDMRGTTGVWHADVGGWTLKIRISTYGNSDPGALRVLADTLLTNASADMQTARDCVGAGRGAAPNLGISGEEAIQVQVGVSMLGITLAESIPDSPTAARAAGYVCLGETLDSRRGHQVVAVMLRPGAQPRAEADPMSLVILALGEIRDADSMIAVVDMSMNPFLVEGQRADRGHFAFGRSASETAFYGALNGGEPRLTAAQVAAYVADGGAPMVSIRSTAQQ